MDSNELEANHLQTSGDRQNEDSNRVYDGDDGPTTPHERRIGNTGDEEEEHDGRKTQLLGIGQSNTFDREETLHQQLDQPHVQSAQDADHYEQPEKVYEQESDVFGMAEKENEPGQIEPLPEEEKPTDFEETNQNQNQNGHFVENTNQEPPGENEVLADADGGEPRITHTGSKTFTDSRAEDMLLRSIGGYEWEAVRSIFRMFETDGNVKISDTGELLRCLNLNPTEAEVAEISKELSPDGQEITWDIFLPKFTDVIESGRFQPVAEQDLLAAFCTLDPQLSGLLTVQQLRDALTAYGEVLTDEEFEELIKFAPKDPDSGMINYKDYAKELCAR